jgi:hypothetical protein
LAAASQGLPEYLAVLRLCGPAVLCRPDAERPDDIIVEVSDCQCGHNALHATNAVNACIYVALRSEGRGSESHRIVHIAKRALWKQNRALWK